MKTILVILCLGLAGCAWTDHHWDYPTNATPDEIKKVDLHNCQEDAIQASRSDPDAFNKALPAIGGGIFGGAIGGAVVGAFSSDSVEDEQNKLIQECMHRKKVTK